MRKTCRKEFYKVKVKDIKQSKHKDWSQYEAKRLCGLPSGSGKIISFSNLEQDIPDPDILTNLVTDTL